MFDIVDSIQVGMLLIAKNTFEYPNGRQGLIKGLPYKVVAIEDSTFTVKTSTGYEVKFKFSSVLDYFSHAWID